jgi:uncharacterized protein (DUF3084 family)
MSGWSLYAAEIMEALGKPEAAATLRWGFPDSIGDVLDELDTAREELEEARGEVGEANCERDDMGGRVDEARADLKRLKKMLCKPCKAKWTAS